MKQPVEKRTPSGFLDFLSLAVTTFGVGYIPGAPGTYGSMVAVVIYLFFVWLVAIASIFVFGGDGKITDVFWKWTTAVGAVSLIILTLVGIWAAGRSVALLGNEDPPEAVIDEIIGQLVVFAFVPLTFHGSMILPGFLLFRLFDIWKPFPIDSLEELPGGLGIVADDMVAGVYAGVCLAVGHAVYTSL